MDRLSDRPDMTLFVYRGRKTTTQQNNNNNNKKLPKVRGNLIEGPFNECGCLKKNPSIRLMASRP